MTVEEIEAAFETYSEVAHTDKLRAPTGTPWTCERADLNAFLLLDKLCPGTGDIVTAAEHDEIYLRPSLEDLAASAITEADIITLIECGVFLSEESLSMFV